MSSLANANAQAKVIRVLRRAGFQDKEGAKHTIMVHADGRYTTVPRHPRINPHTLRAILKQCRISEDEYLRIY